LQRPLLQPTPADGNNIVSVNKLQLKSRCVGQESEAATISVCELTGERGPVMLAEQVPAADTS
jgi:hypothetical protein